MNKGLPPPPARATKAAAEVAEKLLQDPGASTDVRTAARAIVRSYEIGSKLLPEHVELCINHIHRSLSQDRYGR